MKKTLIHYSGWFLLARLYLIVHVITAVRIANAELPRVVSDLLSRNCISCHGSENSEGGLDVQSLKWQPESVDSIKRWELIYDRVAKEEMPPNGEAELAAEARQRFLEELSEPLHAADYGLVVTQGRGPMRRLNRFEYEQNLRDLLQLPDLDIRDRLPEDREAFQTNKLANALDITRVQLAAYLDAADVALRAAVASGVQPRTPTRYFALATKMFPKAVDHAGRESSFYAKDSRMIPFSDSDLRKIRKSDSHDPEMEVAIFRSAAWPYYGYPEEFLAEADGRYQVRFFARAVRQLRDFRLVPSTAPQPMTFRARQPSKADVSGDVRATGGTLDITPEGSIYETMIHLNRNETFEYSLLGLPVPHPITSHGGPLYYDFPPMPEAGHPGIAFRWIEVLGPIDEQTWPPASHRVLYGDLPLQKNKQIDAGCLPVAVVSEAPYRDAKRLFTHFAIQAARGPVSPDSLEIFESLIQDQLSQGVPFAEAMLVGYRAFLCSGHFLFLREPGLEQGDADGHFAIASRLSHLLWNSRPDRQLLELAAAQRLRQPSVLGEETDRLIADSRFEHFIHNFTDYWLDLKTLKRDPPDIRLYPEYRGDDYLVESAGQETRAFIAKLFYDNLPISNLVHSKFAMLNDRLASHYNLPAVAGSFMRAAALPSWSERGGILTQAAILKVTSNGTTTSPVIRGAWIMDRILGDPPPPPPAKVPAIEPDIRGATTIRELLAKHSESESCGACHRRFDPVGFALENFDILGGWRDRYRSLEKGDEITGIDRAGHHYAYRVASEVDSSGQLLDGREFADIHELKAILAGQSRNLARNLLRRLVTYATGTPMRFSDRRVIEAILDESEADDYRVLDLLEGLICSRIFLGTGPQLTIAE